MKKLILFDVCWTLVNTNSTYSYINFLIKNWIKSYYKPLFFEKYIWLLYHFLSKIFKKDIKRDLAVHYMAWLRVSQLQELNNKYYNEFYRYTLKENIFNKLKSLQNRWDIYLLSASINPPIDLLKDNIDVSWFSSTLEEKNWIYTWKLTLDLLWKKENIFFSKKLNIDNYDEIEFFTDNQEDISIINYLNQHNKNFKINIILKNNKNYWDNYFKNKKIKYEFIY